MTSPSAQKAAGEIDKLLEHPWSVDEVAAIIQQAITEAVDAAVEQERERYKGLAEEFRLTGVGSGLLRIQEEKEVTKKEKAILKLAQKWAKLETTETKYEYAKMWQRYLCGRALLKILEP